jgi:DHA1 family inner membrane transport protein
MSPLLFALFLATFAIGTTEFAVVGLLPDIAASLDVSISRAGLLVSGYALGVAIGGPHCRPYIVAAAQADAPAALRDFRRGSRVGRAGAGLWLADGRERACGDFACLVPRHCPDRGRGERSSRSAARAVSFVWLGFSAASLVGVPSATAIGHAFGWRAAFWMLAAVGIIAGAALQLSSIKAA